MRKYDATTAETLRSHSGNLAAVGVTPALGLLKGQLVVQGSA